MTNGAESVTNNSAGSESKDTKVRSTNFGIAARTGKALRSALFQQLPFPLDKTMQSKFSGAIAKWLGLQSLAQLQPVEDMQYVYNFRFNHDISFTELFRVPFTVSSLPSNQFQISISAFVPALSIGAPKETVSIECSFTVAGCALAGGTATGSYAHLFNINYDDAPVPAQNIVLPFLQAPGSLIVITAGLTYTIMKEGKLVKCDNRSYMPLTIVKAIYC